MQLSGCMLLSQRTPFWRTFYIVLASVIFFFINLCVIFHYVQSKTSVQHNEPFPEQDGYIPEEIVRPTFLDSCNITEPLAINALARVRTEQCRLKITEAACKLKNNLFHEQFPESVCINHDQLLINLNVGCFADSVKKRTLSGFAYEFKTDNSLEKCRAHCYRAGFIYHGLEFGRECFCGDFINSTLLPSDRCREYKCPGNHSENCGGFNAIVIYRTGLREHHVLPKTKYYESELVDSVPAVKIFFLLQLNGRNERQVKRLLKAIYSPNHIYYIHVDQRQLFMLTEMKAVAAKLSNVYVSQDIHSTIWGGASLLSMLQDAIRTSLSNPGLYDWDFLINLSESDFPVMTLSELEAQLKINIGKSFLSSHGYNTARFIQKQGFDYVFIECENRMWRIGKRIEFPRNLRIDGGSDWVVLHRDFAEYSVSNEDLPTKMRLLFSTIILPVESFFHTLAYNSRFCNSIISGNLRLTNWNRKQGCRCASLKYVVDWCGCSPLVFKKDHTLKFNLERAKDKPFYIARKFESLIDIDAIAVAETQAMRDRPHLIHSNNILFNATFVNFYKADIDGYSRSNFLLAESLLGMQMKDAELIALLRIDIYRAHSAVMPQMVFTLQIRDTSEPVQLLVEHQPRSSIISPAIVDGYQLIAVQAGVDIDHKEEVFRGITGYIDLEGIPTVSLRWKRVQNIATTVNETKSSPTIKFSWRNSLNQTVASQILRPYDSIYGTQFSILELSKLNLTTSQSGVWSVLVHDASVIAIISFPVFSTSNTAQFHSLVKEYFIVKDSCKGSSCTNIIWSTFHPDPKSDILSGYDKDLQCLV